MIKTVYQFLSSKTGWSEEKVEQMYDEFVTSNPKVELSRQIYSQIDIKLNRYKFSSKTGQLEEKVKQMYDEFVTSYPKVGISRQI